MQPSAAVARGNTRANTVNNETRHENNSEPLSLNGKTKAISYGLRVSDNSMSELSKLLGAKTDMCGKF